MNSQSDQLPAWYFYANVKQVPNNYCKERLEYCCELSPFLKGEMMLSLKNFLCMVIVKIKWSELLPYGGRNVDGFHVIYWKFFLLILRRLLRWSECRIPILTRSAQIFTLTESCFMNCRQAHSLIHTWATKTRYYLPILRQICCARYFPGRRCVLLKHTRSKRIARGQRPCS